MRPHWTGWSYCYSSVSIHASVKDATNYYEQAKNIFLSFNPRICKRCDGNWIKDREYFNVSIHASVKDATEK